MARPVLFAVLLAVTGVAACGGTKASGPAIVAGAPAGKVTTLQGVVTATRGAARRTLATGDDVSGDDVIETGADGRVTVLLAHNQVPFSLGPGRRQVVGASPAWSAPRGTEVAVTSGDRSGAAGRHAEREAADTLASAPSAAAPAAAPAAPTAPPPPAEPAVAMAEVTTAAPARKSAPRTGSVDDERAAATMTVRTEAGGGGSGSGSGAEIADLLTTESVDRERRIAGQLGRGDAVGEVTGTLTDPANLAPAGPPPRLVASIDPVDVHGGLAADVVLRKVRSRGLSLRECAGATPTVTGFDLTFVVAPTGAVRASDATGGSTDVDSCLAKTVGSLRFPAAKAPTTAHLRLDLLAR